MPAAPQPPGAKLLRLLDRELPAELDLHLIVDRAIPDADASQCVEATIPKVPRSSGAW